MIIDKATVLKLIGSHSRLRILACLWETQSELSLRQISDYCHMPFASVQRSVGLLERHRLLLKRNVGRSHLYRLFAEHYFATDILTSLLTNRLDECLDCLLIASKKQSHTVCLFGSYARNTPTPSSDLDLLILSTKPEAIEKSLSKITPALEKRYGLLISPYIKTPKVFKQLIVKGASTEHSILKQHRLLWGVPLQDVIQ